MNKSNKNNGFTTPKSYFDNLKEELMGKLSEESSSLPESDGFVVPENYFETLNEKVLSKVDEKETKVVQLRPYRKFYFAAASIAAIALVIFGFYWNSSKAPTFESLAESDIESYFENNEYDLSADEIAEVIPLYELEINDILTNRFEEDNVVDYLNENIDDFEEPNLEDYE